MKNKIIRAVIEVGFIMILFYSNLLMGEYIRSGQGFQRGLVWSILDIFTPLNLVIALVTGITAYVVAEYLRTVMRSV